TIPRPAWHHGHSTGPVHQALRRLPATHHTAGAGPGPAVTDRHPGPGRHPRRPPRPHHHPGTSRRRRAHHPTRDRPTHRDGPTRRTPDLPGQPGLTARTTPEGLPKGTTWSAMVAAGVVVRVPRVALLGTHHGSGRSCVPTLSSRDRSRRPFVRCRS